MCLLSTCVPFLGICGIHVAAPLLLELECSLCPECDVSLGRSSLLLVRKLCINDVRLFRGFYQNFLFQDAFSW